MIKKPNEMTEPEKMITIGSLPEQDSLREVSIRSIEPAVARKNVNLMIHGWLVDIWLLTTGEGLDAEPTGSELARLDPLASHGRPLAFLSDGLGEGQLRLLANPATTLEALRDVGIEMS